MNPNKEKNLRPVMNSQEARERGRRGGLASAKAKQEKKTIRELAKILLESETTLKDGSKKSNKEMMLLAQFKKAVQEGDLNAAKWLTDLIGETPAKAVEVTGKDGAALIPAVHVEIIDTADQVRRGGDDG